MAKGQTAVIRKPRQPRRPTTSEAGGWTALTPERQAKIVESIAKGVHLEVAARVAGVDGSTYRRWMIAGQDRVDPGTGEVVPAQEPYRTFRAAVEDAEAQLEERAVAQVLTGSMALPFGNTQGLYTFLARRFRQRWSPKDAIEISGPEGGPVRVEGTADDRLAGVLAALARTGKITLTGDEAGPVDEPDAEASE